MKSLAKMYAFVIRFILACMVVFPSNLHCMNVQTRLHNLKDNLGHLNNALELLTTRLTELKSTLGKEKAPEYLLATGLHKKSMLVYDDTNPVQKRIKATFKNTDVYDVKVLSQIQPIKGSLYNRTLYGCGFQAIKNVIFIAKILRSQDLNQYDKDALLSAPIFLRYFEQDPFESSWYSLWNKYRTDHNIQCMPIGDPPAQEYDLENLKAKIIMHEARAPEHASEIMEQLTILEYLEGGQHHRTTLYDVLVLIELAQDFQGRDSVILPFALSYTHAYSTPEQAKNPLAYGSLGRHWIAVVVNKWQNSTEVFFADGWRNPNYIHKNWESVELLLNWLVRTDETMSQYFNVRETLKKQEVSARELQNFNRAIDYILTSPQLKNNKYVIVFKDRLAALLTWYTMHAKNDKNVFEDMLKRLRQLG